MLDDYDFTSLNAIDAKDEDFGGNRGFELFLDIQIWQKDKGKEETD